MKNSNAVAAMYLGVEATAKHTKATNRVTYSREGEIAKRNCHWDNRAKKKTLWCLITAYFKTALCTVRSPYSRPLVALQFFFFATCCTSQFREKNRNCHFEKLSSWHLKRLNRSWATSATAFKSHTNIYQLKHIALWSYCAMFCFCSPFLTGTRQRNGTYQLFSPHYAKCPKLGYKQISHHLCHLHNPPPGFEKSSVHFHCCQFCCHSTAWWSDFNRELAQSVSWNMQFPLIEIENDWSQE